jgi:acetoin utilization protein AcuB
MHPQTQSGLSADPTVPTTFPLEAVMRVQDVMTEHVQTISPSSAAEDAWELMRRHDFHHVVVTRGSRVVGVLSHRDAGGRQGASVRRGRTVEELMTTSVVTVEPTATVRKAANLMRGHSIGCVVVSNQGRVVGIVTVADLLDLLGRGVDRPAPPDTRVTLRHRTPHRKRSSATGMW